ncbi:MAG: Stp1/IreP family PP2C-type Ser/Thr phosphatase [Oscillospiraceae bacterium]
MRVSARTDIGRVRKENQDNYRAVNVRDGIAWGVVCDGMGGGEDGKLASGIAVQTLEKAFAKGLKARTGQDATRDLMLDAIRQANTEIFGYTNNGARVIGTTVVCAVVNKGILHLAHAGDSRAYLFTGEVLKLLTRDHSMVQELVDRGAITPEQAEYHPDKNVITRALGVEPELAVDYGRSEFKPGSTLLLCTDGLTNLVDNRQLGRILSGTDFFKLADDLVQKALSAGGNDNITVVLMQEEANDG